MNWRSAGCFVLAEELYQTPPVHQYLISLSKSPSKRSRQQVKKRKLPTTTRFSDELQTRSRIGPLWTTFKRQTGDSLQ